MKSEFFRKVHNKNPPFRFKVKTAAREAIQIPPMIEYHYKNPPSLLPSLRDILRCEAVHKKGTGHELLHSDLTIMVQDQLRELRDANKKIQNFNSSDDYDNTDFSCDPQIQDSDQADDTDGNNKTDNDDDATIAKEESKDDQLLSLNFDKNLAKANEELEKIDLPIIKLLALQRLQQILAEHPDVVQRYQEESTNRAIQAALVSQTTTAAATNNNNNQMAMPSQLLTKDDIERIARKFSNPSSSLSATGGSTDNSQEQMECCRTPSPIPAIDSSIDSKRIKHSKLYCGNEFDELQNCIDKAKAIALRLETPIMESKIRARAILTPVGDILNGERYVI